MKRAINVIVVVAAFLVLLPGAAFAQEGQIAGTVRDSSGGVMPTLPNSRSGKWGNTSVHRHDVPWGTIDRPSPALCANRGHGTGVSDGRGVTRRVGGEPAAAGMGSLPAVQ